MATLVTINQNTGRSNELISAIRQISSGFGKLYELDGVRAQYIGTSQTAMCNGFGPATTDDAQALSDRWAYLVAAMTDPTHEAYAGLQCLRDFLDATVFK